MAEAEQILRTNSGIFPDPDRVKDVLAVTGSTIRPGGV